MADKYFNRSEAQELLPVITRELEQVRRRKQTIDQLEQELAQAAARIMMLGGSIPNHEELTKKRTEGLRLTAQLKQAIDRIQATGCVVKDLDEGLVDFPSLLDGQEVYLCWKLGEERIAYWHGLEEGFAGRKPLDQPAQEDESPPDRVN
jgi:hypothetical protein